MRHLSYNFGVLVSGLCLTFLASSSFGSDRFTQEETQEQIRTAATTLQRTVDFSPESTLPHEIRLHILSFLTKQNDLLRIGAVSKSWREAAAKVWEKRFLNLSYKPLTADHYTMLAKGLFPRLRLNLVKLDEAGMDILATGSHLQALELHGNNLRATESLLKLFSLSHLSYIDLAFNYIGDKGVVALVPSLQTLTFPSAINLSSNRIGGKGGKAIAAALKENKTLTMVDLYNNKIGNREPKQLQWLSKRIRP